MKKHLKIGITQLVIHAGYSAVIDTRSPVLESKIVEERVSEKEKGHKVLFKQFLQGAPD